MDDFAQLHNGCKRGDIVGVEGFPGKSKLGELSIFATRLVVLSYCLHMLPKRRLENQVLPLYCSVSLICQIAAILRMLMLLRVA